MKKINSKYFDSHKNVATHANQRRKKEKSQNALHNLIPPTYFSESAFLNFVFLNLFTKNQLHIKLLNLIAILLTIQTKFTLNLLKIT